jgi:hypothetical protein
MTPTAPNIYAGFAIPFAEAFHPEPGPLNAQLKSLILAREAEGDRYLNKNPSLKQQPGVFESEFNLFSWPEPCIKALQTFCWGQLGLTVQELNRYSAEQLQRIQIFSHTWFHVTRKPGATITHNHPMASWSGVYCVAAGSPAPEHPESGVLRFHNPHYWSSTFLDAGNMRLAAPYHHGFWNLQLKAGQLVLFPSWIPHEVMPYHGDEERITIAFNCWFGMRE